MDADLELLGQWRQGDRQAGEVLFQRHFAGLYRFFENKVGSEADDLVQRTFLACVKARDQFRAQSSFRTYLFTIAKHELYALFRQRRQNAEVDFGVTSIADLTPSPTSRLARAQAVGQLRAALETLPTDQQLLLELHYWHELDAAALAEVFETSAGNIRVRLLRARTALRGEMARQEGGTALLATGTDSLSQSLVQPELDDRENREATPDQGSRG